MRLSKLSVILLLTPVTLLFFSCQKKFDSSSDAPKPTGIELQASLKKDLWGFYTFNHSFSDQSGNNHDLTPSNSLKLTYDIIGNPDAAVEFNEADDYAIIDAGKNFPDSDFSISFTVMPTVMNGNIFQKVDFATNKGYSFAIGLDNTASNKFLFSTNQAGDPCSSAFNTNTPTAITGDRTLFPNAWYYVCFTFKGGEELIYVNGELIADLKTPVSTLQHCQSAPFYLGVPAAAGIPGFMGKVDNLRIYSRALTEDEVIYLMETYK